MCTWNSWGLFAYDGREDYFHRLVELACEKENLAALEGCQMRRGWPIGIAYEQNFDDIVRWKCHHK